MGLVGAAHADNQKAITTGAHVYTLEEIKKMDLEELFMLGDELNASLQKINNIIRRLPGEEIDFNAVYDLARFPVEESLRLLHGLLRSEFVKADSNGEVPMNEYVVDLAIKALERLGTAFPETNIQELHQVMGEANNHLKRADALEIVTRLKIVESYMQERQWQLVNLNDFIDGKKRELNGSRERLSRVEKWLENRVKGQPELIKAGMDLEWRAELYGKGRKKPDVLYMLGLWGSGKDTFAESFTDALHLFEGAHHEHMFRINPLKKNADLWGLLGSATGYVGSEAFPPFLAFLVKHAGGKYKLEIKENNKGEKTYSIHNNPEWQGETLPGYYAPSSGVVFLNEFHNWSRQMKDDLVKQALEKGIFNVNNPNGGLSHIEVPIRFLIASNEGATLTKGRTYEQVYKGWERVHENKAALKSEIMKTNDTRNGSFRGEESPGISHELLNRVPDRFTILMRPISPDNLQSIAEIALKDLAKKLGTQSKLLSNVKLTWSPKLIETIQAYDYMPEENARPIVGDNGRISSFVEYPLLDAIRAGRLVTDEGGETALDLDIIENADHTRSLAVKVKTSGGREYDFEQLITPTLKDVPKPEISDTRIDELADLDQELKTVVFGIDPILERLAHQILTIENDVAAGVAREANVIMLTGLTSTGKTETAKRLSEFTTGHDDELVTFDFSKIQTLFDFKEQILGLTDALGNPIPSKFMQAYDRANGRLVVAFDELANVRDRDVLKSLYDFFREKTVTTFSDGKPRAMGGVTVVITGNAGQELYTQVPSDIPMEAQMRAWAEIYKRTNADRALQRRILEKYYPEPLIARIGENNIFFVPPHSYKSLRQLAQLKMEGAIKRIADTKSRRGWDVVFPSATEYNLFVDTVIDEGFELRSQGASIDNFVRNDFEKPINGLLLRAKVPSGTRVVLKHRESTDNGKQEKPGFVVYDVYVEGRPDPLEFKIRRPHVDKPVEKREIDQIMTAYHEAGHSIARQVLYKGAFDPTIVSIVPGVTLIANEWVYYAGLASAEQRKEYSTTREWAVSETAILAAGFMGEQLASQKWRDTAGKSNDAKRASKLIRAAVLRYGLAAPWGFEAIPSDLSEEAYLATLSNEKRRFLEKTIEDLIVESVKLAKAVLEANWNNAMVPLATTLSEKGLLKEDELAAFYKERTLVHPNERSTWTSWVDSMRTRFRKMKNPRAANMNLEMDVKLPKPKSVADVAEMAAAEKRELYKEVALPAKLPLGTNESFDRAFNVKKILSLPKPANSSCGELLGEAV